FVLQIDGHVKRKFYVARDPARFMRRVALSAVQSERQTNYHPARVKLLAQVFDFAQESLPVAPAQGGQRAGGQTQLVGDGDADAARAQVEREQTTMRGDGRICV